MITHPRSHRHRARRGAAAAGRGGPAARGARAGRGRATIVSPERVPSFDNSAMDGYAVARRRARRRAAASSAWSSTSPPAAGSTQDVGAGDAAKIMTGAPLPPGVDTVVPVELTAQSGDTLIVNEPVRPGANVRRAAEDVAAGDVLFPRGARLGPAEIGLLASVGYERVARRPPAARRHPGHRQRAGRRRRSRSAPARSATPTRSPPTARCSPPAASRCCSASPATTSTRRGG